MTTRRNFVRMAFAGSMLASGSGHSLAQSGSQAPLKFIVPYSPGGSTDLIARALSESLAKRLGRPVVVVNHPGAGGTLGTAAVARSSPDGNTLLMATNGTHSINPTLYENLPYDAVKDFEPISLVAAVPLLLCVPARSKIESIKQLTETSGTDRKLSFGSAGVGSSGHLAGEMLNTQAKLNAVHVPYKGDGPAVVDLISGSIDYLFANLPAILQQARAGSVRPLAITSVNRSSDIPDVPTVTEAGFPLLQIDPWYGVYAPRGIASSLVSQLNSAINDSLQEPDIRDRLRRAGVTPIGTSPERFAQVAAFDTERFAAVIKASGAKAQ